MNTWRLMMVLIAGGALAAACTTTSPSDDDSADGGSGGTGGTGVTGPATGPGPTSGTTVGATTGQMMGGGICNSGLTSGTDGEDACLSASCCDSFNACVADADCQACLTNAQAPGCDTNMLLDAFNTCSDANCATNVCDEGITFSDGNGDPAFACISCASETAACCTALDTCTGDDSQAAITDCLTCLNDDAINSATPTEPMTGDCADIGNGIPAAATAFQQCLVDNCSTECGIM